MELREKVADDIEPSLWEGGGRADALHIADAILAIPEIAEALRMTYALSPENRALWQQALMREGKIKQQWPNT